MKIFDCITFFEEHLVTKIRFNILNKYVDKFIVCEGSQNHKGESKKINFDKNQYPEFKHKISHIICQEFPKNLNPWQRQAFQRDIILKHLQEADDNDLILFSDPDEIPNPEKLVNFKINKKYVIFLQKLFYYKLNLQNVKLGSNWEGTRGCLKKHLKSIDYMRQKVLKKNSKYSFFRIDKERNFEIIKDGGWHFSYLLNAEEIKKKIQTFAHSELNTNTHTDINYINKCIKNRIDLFGRPLFFEKVDIDKTYPNFIINNKNMFKNWII